MWDVIELKMKFYIAIVPAVLSFYTMNVLLDLTFLKSLSYTVTLLTVLAYVVGKYLWKYIYFDFLNKYICPNINGSWVAYIDSNFEGGVKVQLPVIIKADFFDITMSIKTTVGRSYASYCKVIKMNDGSYELQYIFNVKNYTVLSTDSDCYDGAARLEIDVNDLKRMQGVFWTNRNWRDNKNTAGKIIMSRES